MIALPGEEGEAEAISLAEVKNKPVNAKKRAEEQKREERNRRRREERAAAKLAAAK